jgi:transcriptional regulator with XRE-family HTH domain
MAKKSYKALLREAKQSDSYWIEALKVEVASSLARVARQQQISKADLAGKLGTSKAYITKVFRGDTNFTIETLVKLARAVDAKWVVELLPEHGLAESPPSAVTNTHGNWSVTLSSVFHVEAVKDAPQFGKFVPVVVPKEVTNDAEFYESQPAAA